MGGVDQSIDALPDEIVREAPRRAEAADADRHRLRGGRGRTAGERQRDLEAGTAGEAPGQLPIQQCRRE